MTREEAIAKLKAAQQSGDTEAAHGDSDVVLEWAKVDKLYA